MTRPVPDFTAECQGEDHFICPGKLWWMPTPTEVESGMTMKAFPCLCPCHGPAGSQRYRYEAHGDIGEQRSTIERLGAEGWEFVAFVSHWGAFDGKTMLFRRATPKPYDPGDLGLELKLKGLAEQMRKGRWINVLSRLHELAGMALSKLNRELKDQG